MVTEMEPKKARKESEARLVCEFCNAQAARQVRLNHTFGSGAKMIVVANVETIVCDNCGQRYVEGEALETLNRILANPDTYARQQMIPVADFALV